MRTTKQDTWKHDLYNFQGFAHKWTRCKGSAASLSNRLIEPTMPIVPPISIRIRPRHVDCDTANCPPRQPVKPPGSKVVRLGTKVVRRCVRNRCMKLRRLTNSTGFHSRTSQSTATPISGGHSVRLMHSQHTHLQYVATQTSTSEAQDKLHRSTRFETIFMTLFGAAFVFSKQHRWLYLGVFVALQVVTILWPSCIPQPCQLRALSSSKLWHRITDTMNALQRKVDRALLTKKALKRVQKQMWFVRSYLRSVKRAFHEKTLHHLRKEVDYYSQQRRFTR